MAAQSNPTTPSCLHWSLGAGCQEILVEGKNCWRICKANRISFLIDGQAYFTAFVRAVEKARKSIYIAGWDINSRLALIRGAETPVEDFRLHNFLTKVVSKTTDLEIHILIWDFAMIFALERELFPVFRLGWRNHKRIHFHMDNEHPLGGSHHQKIVVIDDALAFVGGIDLTKSRWDTPEHLENDSRRVDPDGRAYPPFHDVQMIAEGEVAQSLGEYFRVRWQRATGERLIAPGIDNGAAWPLDLQPDITDAYVGIARTEPPYKGQPAVKEVERLHVDAITAAKRYIYIENQYLTSSTMREALASSLSKEAGPEIVILLPLASSGWLEASTMDTGRNFVLNDLQLADRFGRLKVYYPVIPGVDPTLMTLHSKVLIVDDCFVRIGSSNLSNRSMGLDTECDLAVVSQGNEKIAKSVALFRNTLIAEHLGREIEEVGQTIRRIGSLINSIEHLRGSDRTLEPLKVEVPEWLAEIVRRGNPADPERPIDPERLLSDLLPEEVPTPKRIQFLKIGVAAAFLFGLAAAWRWGPLSGLVDPAALAEWATAISRHPMAPFFVIGAFILGGFILVPVTLLIATVALIFEPATSIFYGLAGSLASAMALFAVGRKIGRESVRHLAGDKVNKISKRLASRGVLTVMTLRLVPVAPYTIVNLVLGASHVKVKDFVLGTLLGVAPGIVAISVLGDRLTAIVRKPQTENLVLLASVILLAAFAFFVLKRFYRKHNSPGRSD